MKFMIVKYYDHYEVDHTKNPYKEKPIIIKDYGIYLGEDEKYLYLLWSETLEDDEIRHRHITAIYKKAIIKIKEVDISV